MVQQLRARLAGLDGSGRLSFLFLLVGLVVGLLVGGVGSSGPVSTGGPARVEGGVGQGFAQSSEGAALAAANVVEALGSAQAAPAFTRQTIVEMVVAEGSQRSMISSLELAESQMRLDLTTTSGIYLQPNIEVTPLGFVVTAFAADRAVVEVWYVTTVAVEGLEFPVAAWETALVELVWERGDWRVWSTKTSPGPSPHLSAVVGETGSTFVARANRFSAYGVGVL